MSSPEASTPRREEIWLVNFDPTIGTEIRKTRPAVVVSSDAVGRLPIKLVAPVTDWKEYYTPNVWHVRIDPDPANGLTKVSALILCNCVAWITAGSFGSWGKFHPQRWRKLSWQLRPSSNIHNAARNFGFSLADSGKVGAKSMKQKSFLRVLGFHSDNRKSKTCPFDKLRAGSEQDRRVENLKWVGLFAIVVALTVCAARVDAQQAGKVPRIGFLDQSTASGSAVLAEAFRQELRKLGWIEGKNIAIECIGLPSKRMSACLNLQGTWFVLRLN